MCEGTEAVTGVSWMQWSSGPVHISETQRHHKARVLAMVSATLDQAYAESRRKYADTEEWLNYKLQVCGPARQRNGGVEEQLAVGYLRLDYRGSTRRPRVQS